MLPSLNLDSLGWLDNQRKTKLKALEKFETVKSAIVPLPSEKPLASTQELNQRQENLENSSGNSSETILPLTSEKKHLCDICFIMETPV